MHGVRWKALPPLSATHTYVSSDAGFGRRLAHAPKNIENDNNKQSPITQVLILIISLSIFSFWYHIHFLLGRLLINRTMAIVARISTTISGIIKLKKRIGSGPSLNSSLRERGAAANNAKSTMKLLMSSVLQIDVFSLIFALWQLPSSYDPL